MEPIVETRSRSRSKTPGLLSSVDKEIKKVPNVSIIAEEPEIIPSSQGTNRPKRIRKQVITSDYSSDDFSPDSSKANRRSKDDEPLKKPASKKSPEAVKNGDKKEKVVVSSTTTTIIQTTTVKPLNGNEEKIVSSETTDIIKEVAPKDPSVGLFDTVFNAIKTSTPIMYAKRSKRIAAAAETVQVDAAPLHLAYNEYKEAGEYWNKTPKTDYTYSELSPHRRELGKGSQATVAMPNMSRKSLDKYQNRVESMIHANPDQESFLRRRFLSNFTTNTNSRYSSGPALNYDSQDEIDLSEFDRKYKKQKQSMNVFSTFFLFLINTFYSCVYSIKRVFTKNDQYLYSTPAKKQEAGVFTRSYEATKGFFLWIVSKFYLLVSHVMLWDTYLLQSQDGGQKKKRFLIGLLVLLPILLLGGLYAYLDPKLSLPSLPKITFPKISLPAMPKFSFPEISFPKLSWPSFLTFSLPSISFPSVSFPTFSWPSFLTFSIPTFSLPSFSWPSFLTFSLPSFSWPSWPSFLTFTIPTFSFPSFSWPSFLTFSLPNFSWPSISFPALPSFSWPSVSLPKFTLFDSFSLTWLTRPVLDSLDSLKLGSVEIFGRIKNATVEAINEAQIVFNENFIA